MLMDDSDLLSPDGQQGPPHCVLATINTPGERTRSTCPGGRDAPDRRMYVSKSIICFPPIKSIQAVKGPSPGHRLSAPVIYHLYPVSPVLLNPVVGRPRRIIKQIYYSLKTRPEEADKQTHIVLAPPFCSVVCLSARCREGANRNLTGLSLSPVTLTRGADPPCD